MRSRILCIRPFESTNRERRAAAWKLTAMILALLNAAAMNLNAQEVVAELVGDLQGLESEGYKSIQTVSNDSPPSATTLEGIVVDTEGRPLAEVRVNIGSAAPRFGPSLFCSTCYRDCSKWTETDAAGHFRIEHLDASLKFRLLCVATGKESLATGLVDPLKGSIKLTLEDGAGGVPVRRIVQGRVLSESGSPVEGALVSPRGAKKGCRHWWGPVEGVQSTITSPDGNFQMPLPIGVQAVELDITAAGHAGFRTPLVTPGPEKKEIVVPVGATVHGQVVYQGKPYSGLRIAVLQLDRNSGSYLMRAVEATTDDVGRFTFKHLPPDQPYTIYSVLDGRPSEVALSTTRFDARSSGKQQDLGTLELVESIRLAGRFGLPENTALPEHAHLNIKRKDAWDLVSVPIDKHGYFAISGLSPEAYQVRVVADGLEIDADRLTYEQSRLNHFRVDLLGSNEELRIPLRKVIAKAERTLRPKPKRSVPKREQYGFGSQ